MDVDSHFLLEETSRLDTKTHDVTSNVVVVSVHISVISILVLTIINTSDPNRLEIARYILWPVPFCWKLQPTLNPVSFLLSNPGIVAERKRQLRFHTLRWTYLFAWRDSPLYCLYRIYDSLVDLESDELVMETQYWFHEHPNWRLVDIPDPVDPDPARYAILASIAETLVVSFNYKIGLGLRRGITHMQPWRVGEFQGDTEPPLEAFPPWTSKVGRLEEVLYLDNQEAPSLEESESIIRRGKNRFWIRNIVAHDRDFDNI